LGRFGDKTSRITNKYQSSYRRGGISIFHIWNPDIPYRRAETWALDTDPVLPVISPCIALARRGKETGKMTALEQALEALGGTELPSASQCKPRARRARRIALTPELARAAGQDAANVRMRAEGRKTWSQDDYNTAVTVCNELLDATVQTSVANPPVPTPISRAFVTAGKAIFTISKLATGERFTYKVSAPDNFRGEYFGSVMKGSDNENDYRYVGMVAQSDLSLRFTKGSKFAADTKEARGLAFALAVVAGRKTLPEGYELRLDFEEDRPSPVERAWKQRGILEFKEPERIALFKQLTDMSNSEDAAARREKDRDLAKYARGASRALATVASKVLRMGKERRA
jgi:hypothetical protein